MAFKTTQTKGSVAWRYRKVRDIIGVGKLERLDGRWWQNGRRTHTRRDGDKEEQPHSLTYQLFRSVFDSDWRPSHKGYPDAWGPFLSNPPSDFLANFVTSGGILQEQEVRALY
jgi:hypothetical protein